MLLHFYTLTLLFTSIHFYTFTPLQLFLFYTFIFLLHYFPTFPSGFVESSVGIHILCTRAQCARGKNYYKTGTLSSLSKSIGAFNPELL